MTKTLGIIAGGRQFPFMVAQRAREAGMRVVAVGFSGNTDPALAEVVDVFEMLHLGQLSRCIKFMKANAADSVIFAGAINKPKAMDIRPDLLVAKLLFKLKDKGDNAILSRVLDEFESQGLNVGDPLEFVPGLATPQGPLTAKSPSKADFDDLRFAWPRAKAIGELDIGQALLVKAGIVLAVEGPEGTDAAIRRAGELSSKGCVLCKVYKPGQDMRIDRPAMGLNTVRTMIEAGGTCIGIEAGRSIFFEQAEALALAEQHGISIIGLSPEILGIQS
ncbi:MAG: UDP-2,3-diacylglucosamine diphosphatase LpxI [Proteobacteria bacterium]|nr:UDP-2,3-diacylglucosamine diphosphatase LpxI [Pseudomonadota bacterium]